MRLAVARAIALSPEALFLDDPTGGLDPVNSDDMVDLILKITKEIPITLIIVTHDIYRAYQLAGRNIFVVLSNDTWGYSTFHFSKMSLKSRIKNFKSN